AWFIFPFDWIHWRTAGLSNIFFDPATTEEQSYLDERHMAFVTSSNYMKPNLSTYGQVVAAPTNDHVNIPKPPQNVVSSSSALANSLAFIRPSRTPTSA
nr:transcription regulator [Tanacetum cinerariifolium]